MAPLLDVIDVSKSFGPTKALSGARLSLQPGEIHALVGENGAGKSTLMKILSGVHRADSGRILLQGNEIHPSTPREAQRLGISTVFQELSLCPNLSVAENIFVNREPAFLGFIKSKALTAQTDDYLRQFHVSIAADTRVADLNIAQKQIIEIIKAISFEASVLILDEPTRGIDIGSKIEIYNLLRGFTEQGGSVILVSSELTEIIGLSRPGPRVQRREDRRRTRRDHDGGIRMKLVNNWKDARIVPLPEVIDTGTIVITKANVKSFMRKAGAI